MGRMSEGVRQVLAPLTEMISRLKAKMKIEAVVVFGSRARDEHLVDSDVDVLVVSDDFKGLPRWERGYIILCEWQSHLPLEPIGMTTEELRRCYGLLCWDILEEGVILEDSGIFSQVKDEFERMKQGGLIERTIGGWRFSPALDPEHGVHIASSTPPPHSHD